MLVLVTAGSADHLQAKKRTIYLEPGVKELGHLDGVVIKFLIPLGVLRQTSETEGQQLLARPALMDKNPSAINSFSSFFADPEEG